MSQIFIGILSIILGVALTFISNAKIRFVLLLVIPVTLFSMAFYGYEYFLLDRSTQSGASMVEVGIILASLFSIVIGGVSLLFTLVVKDKFRK